MAATLVATALVSALGPLTMLSFLPTDAAWSDRTHVAATASAATWIRPSSCVPIDANGNRVAGSCSIVSTILVLSDTEGSSRAHIYVVDLQSSVVGRIGFELNLAEASGWPYGNWSWANAATLAWPQVYTTVPGYACAELPVVRGRTTTTNGSGFLTLSFTVVENRSQGGAKSCSF